MKPGRELDAIIAKKVMLTGWCQLMHENACVDGKPRKCKCGATGFPYEHHPPFSTDIAAAWNVVERMRFLDWSVIIDDMCPGRKWQTHFERERHEVFSVTDSDTAPHAICLAALKVLNIPPR